MTEGPRPRSQVVGSGSSLQRASRGVQPIPLQEHPQLAELARQGRTCQGGARYVKIRNSAYGVLLPV